MAVFVGVRAGYRGESEFSVWVIDHTIFHKSIIAGLRAFFLGFVVRVEGFHSNERVIILRTFEFDVGVSSFSLDEKLC